jgi:CRP-like cAMP-binding protein
VFSAQVCVTQTTEGCTEPQEIKTLGVGDYFGEKALIRQDLFTDLFNHLKMFKGKNRSGLVLS